ncbi:MAG TPA: dehypoxanthine futalosine cyclase [Actinobacteria bacterium]|nr:dehypoxanthine futalosine cyclase [Actinomycetota bacterium]
MSAMTTADILDRLAIGKRLDEASAVRLLEGRELLAVGRAAAAARKKRVPGGDVTFVIDRNINYTNICVTGCDFCAFYRPLGSDEGYLLSDGQIYGKIAETIELGGTGIMMQGGLHPGLDIDYYCDLLAGIKERYPQITIHSFSPPEIHHIAVNSRISVAATLERMRDAGLDSLPGGGAEILADGVRRRLSPRKVDSGTWLEVMRQAHRAGLQSTATMMFGSIEGLADRVEHLRRIRELQDETGGFRAFIPWTFQDENTQLEGSASSSGIDYLMTLAVSRLYLDNILNIQASWVTQGLKMAQVALDFGANDLGSTMIEENVVAAAGVTYRVGKEELVRAIGAAGWNPVQRRHDYTPAVPA